MSMGKFTVVQASEYSYEYSGPYNLSSKLRWSWVKGGTNKNYTEAIGIPTKWGYTIILCKNSSGDRNSLLFQGSNYCFYFENLLIS